MPAPLQDECENKKVTFLSLLETPDRLLHRYQRNSVRLRYGVRMEARIQRFKSDWNLGLRAPNPRKLKPA